jgi:hypothetical protein
MPSTTLVGPDWNPIKEKYIYKVATRNRLFPPDLENIKLT